LFIFINLVFLGQLNRPLITPSDDILPSNGDEMVTESDGTLVNKDTILFNYFD
jgi:hypothetical protein